MLDQSRTSNEGSSITELILTKEKEIGMPEKFYKDVFMKAAEDHCIPSRLITFELLVLILRLDHMVTASLSFLRKHMTYLHGVVKPFSVQIMFVKVVSDVFHWCQSESFF